MYELEIARIREKIRNNDYKSILLQAPEGMLDKPIQKVVNELSELQINIMIAGDPSYGVCDLAIDLANKLKCDLLVHFGHSQYGFQHVVDSASNGDVDIMIIPAYYIPQKQIDYLPLKEKLDEYGWKAVGLAATIQHVKTLELLEDFLIENGFEPVKHNSGQIIGCNVNNIKKRRKRYEGIVSLHAGFFHTHGMLLNIDAPILQLNPYTESLTEYTQVNRKQAIQRRFNVLTMAKDARSWGIIGSSKIGQINAQIITKIKTKLNSQNKDIVTVIAENINPQNIDNFQWIDAWVVTACPRLALDDTIRFQRPVVTFREFLYLMDDLSWEDLLSHGFF